MNLPETTTPSSLLSVNWIPLLLDLYQELRRFLERKAHDGLYEMLEYEASLELLDPRGQTEVLKKRQRVQFLQDNVIAFQDHAWGEGDLLVDYRCSPGIEVDRYPEGDRWNILISLRATKGRGDVEDFYIERKIRHGFLKREEWWQLEVQHQTRWLKMNILFPKERHCRQAVLIERNRNRTTALALEHFVELPDGRQMLTWESKKPQRFETYTLKWMW